MGRGMIVPRSLKTKQNKKKFKLGHSFFQKIIYDPFIFAINSFSEIRSINSDRDGFICQAWSKMSKFIPLILRLSGIEFRLV
jgi:hypothetical protein